MTRLAEMFNVNHFIVSQVNPHVIPFLAREDGLEPDEWSGSRGRSSSSIKTGPGWMYTAMNLAKAEILHRMHVLAEIGLFPNAMTKARSVLSQRYSGDITIMPEISYVDDFPGMLRNPSVDSIRHAILAGARATWPKLSRIRNHCAIELALDQVVQQLRARVAFSPSQVDLRRAYRLMNTNTTITTNNTTPPTPTTTTTTTATTTNTIPTHPAIPTATTSTITSLSVDRKRVGHHSYCSCSCPRSCSCPSTTSSTSSSPSFSSSISSSSPSSSSPSSSCHGGERAGGDGGDGGDGDDDGSNNTGEKVAGSSDADDGYPHNGGGGGGGNSNNSNNINNTSTTTTTTTIPTTTTTTTTTSVGRGGINHHHRHRHRHGYGHGHGHGRKGIRRSILVDGRNHH